MFLVKITIEEALKETRNVYARYYFDIREVKVLKEYKNGNAQCRSIDYRYNSVTMEEYPSGYVGYSFKVDKKYLFNTKEEAIKGAINLLMEQMKEHLWVLQR